MRAPRRPGAFLESIHGAVHVVGASSYLVGHRGLTGVVAHDFAADERAFAASFRKANVAWTRKDRERRLGKLRRLPITLHLRDSYLQGIEDADLILASQNWFNYPSNLPALPDAVARGARLRGVVDVAMDLFPGTRIGVTGSNGKSTTSALVRHLLLGAGAGAVRQGGNDRGQQVDLVDLETAAPDDLLVWEVSNRHLRDRPVDVDVAVVTNITRNHIEDHGSWEAYRDAKLRLPHGADHAILCAEDPESARASVEAGATWWFGEALPDRARAVGRRGDRWIARVDGAVLDLGGAPLQLPGTHNARNLAAALAAALAAGAPPDALVDGWADFGGLAGRLEEVARDGDVRWLYDIQATTAPAAEAGLRAIGGRSTVLIVGGDDKGMDYGGMADAAAAHASAVLALPGSGTEAFLGALAGRVGVERFTDLDSLLVDAVDRVPAGGTVLLSPGCAFFHSRFLEDGPTFGQRVASLLAGRALSTDRA
jgi:UDP-N-acetylmuramoylalanine--D-glutamate ligase